MIDSNLPVTVPSWVLQELLVVTESNYLTDDCSRALTIAEKAMREVHYEALRKETPAI